jgi:hypothetical protein
VGLERGPLSLVSTNEELNLTLWPESASELYRQKRSCLEETVAAPGLESREYGRRDSSR